MQKVIFYLKFYDKMPTCTNPKDQNTGIKLNLKTNSLSLLAHGVPDYDAY